MVRLYTESDLQGIAEVLGVLSTSEEAPKFESCLYDIKSYQESYLVKKFYKTFVAEVDKKIIGFILSEHYCNDVLAILMLYVLPNYRRMYHALSLKNAIGNFAKENGYKFIVSQVRTNNPESIRMNKRAGWEINDDKIYPGYYVECKLEITK